VSTKKIVLFTFLTGVAVFYTLPVHAAGQSVANPSEAMTPSAFASAEDPSLTAPVHDPTNCLPECSSAEPEDTADVITAPIQPKNIDVVGPTTGRKCCGTNTTRNERRGIQWRSLILQELFLVGVEHGFRLATEAKTRRELDGPFFGDWAKIISNTQWN
jgi:hypothetical protein